jgi:hypothetical protein
VYQTDFSALCLQCGETGVYFPVTTEDRTACYSPKKQVIRLNCPVAVRDPSIPGACQLANRVEWHHSSSMSSLLRSKVLRVLSISCAIGPCVPDRLLCATAFENPQACINSRWCWIIAHKDTIRYRWLRPAEPDQWEKSRRSHDWRVAPGSCLLRERPSAKPARCGRDSAVCHHWDVPAAGVPLPTVGLPSANVPM